MVAYGSCYGEAESMRERCAQEERSGLKFWKHSVRPRLFLRTWFQKHKLMVSHGNKYFLEARMCKNYCSFYLHSLFMSLMIKLQDD